MIKRICKIPSLVVAMLLIAQLVLPIGSAFANNAGSMLPPTNLAYVNPSPEDVKLTWNAVYGATGYNVYEIKEGQLVLLGTAKTNSFTLNDLPEGSYTYTISTLSGEFESGPSAPITVEVVYPSMEAPGNLTSRIQNGNDVFLTWTASKYAKEYVIYEVLEGGEHKPLKNTASNSYTITNAAEGTYTYAVSASNSFFGESAPTEPITVEVVHPVMQEPSNLTFTISNGTDITLKWNTATYAQRYNVYQILDGQKVLKETVATNSLKLSNQPEGNYKFVVHSVSDRFGESKEGSAVELTVSSIVMQPPVASIKVQNLNDIVLSWTPADLAESYKIYQIIDGEKVLKDTVTGTSKIYQKQPSGEYLFEIHSYSSRFGESEQSASLSILVDSYVLDAPSNGKSEIKNGNDLTLSWDAVLNASQYNVYQIVNSERILKDSITGTSKTYSNLSEGNYEYEIFAFNPRIGESSEGLKISAVITHPEMFPPGNLAYSVTSPTSFSLSWAQSEYATSYNVYQIVNGEKTGKRTVSAKSISYSNMQAGTYQYEVYSYSSKFGESKTGNRVQVTLDGYVMKAPENLTYSILNGNDIKLQWGAVGYAAGYKVYQVTDGEKTLVKTITGTTTTLTNQPEGEFEFVVHSYSNFSSESPEGTVIKISLVHPVMVKPENAAAAIQNGNDVALSWNQVPYATSYNIYELQDQKEVLIGSAASSSSPKKVFANVSEGEHYYIIRSVSSRFGESNEGSGVGIKVEFPLLQNPENLTCILNNGNDINLKWNTAAYATGYKVYQLKDNEKTLLRTVTGTSSTFTNMPEGDYHFLVTSYSDRYGESNASSSIEFQLIHPIMQAPANFTKSISNGNDIVLRWNASLYASAYNIYQIIGGQKEFVKTVKSTSATFINMPEGDYHYEVHSFSDRFGESPVSSRLEVTLVWPEMLASQLQATVFDANNMTFTWTKVTWANRYELYKVQDGRRELLYKGTAQTYKVYNLTEDTHSFEVVAYSDRFGETPASNRHDQTIIYPEMDAPKATLKLLSDTSARISWGFVTYANGYNIYEIIDGAPVLVAEKVNNLSYTLSNLTYANHLYYVTSYSNSFGESEPSESVLAKLIIDDVAPVTVSDSKAEWINGMTTVHLTATDNEVGVAGTYYSLNGSEFIEGTTVTVSGEGIHQLAYYSVDKAGNIELVKTETIKIDSKAPVTGSNVEDKWYQEGLKVELSPKDDFSGASATFYKINGADFIEGNEFMLEDDGIYEVSYYSIDHAGNEEAVKTLTVKIDGLAPETADNVSDRWYNKDAEVVLEANDHLSGVKQTFYSINGSEFVKGTHFTVTDEGISEVSYYSVDAAGNVEEVKSVEVKVDKTAPVLSVNVNEEYQLGTEFEISYTAKDEHSGVAAEEASLNGESIKNGDVIGLDQPGVYTLKVTITDHAGWTTMIEKKFVVYIPVNLEVLPKVIKGNKGIFTVKAELPVEFAGTAFDVSSAVLNSIAPKADNNGLVKQAEKGNFKFEREDFDWTPGKVELQFRAYLENGYLVKGSTIVDVK